MSQKIVILGTGGTIAGLSLVPGAGGRYRAAQVSIDDLVSHATVVAAAGRDVTAGQAAADVECVTEQLAQVDSKDMTEAIWQQMLKRVQALQLDDSVAGIVITHGTDTLEETGFLLQACWPLGKPVVLTCAMRAADAPDADGPANLSDAIRLAATPQLRGVLMVCAGQVFEGHAFQKVHTDLVQPFSAEPLGILGVMNGHYRSMRPADRDGAHPPLDTAWVDRLVTTATWPRIDLVFNHAGADGMVVRALLAQSRDLPPSDKLRGLIVAGTGQGTCSERLEQALREAQHQGVVVWRSTRATFGRARPVAAGELTSAPWPPVKARVAMMIHLLSQQF